MSDWTKQTVELTVEQSNLEDLAGVVARLLEALGARNSYEIAEAYAEALGDIPKELVKAACARLLRTAMRHVPKPARIRLECAKIFFDWKYPSAELAFVNRRQYKEVSELVSGNTYVGNYASEWKKVYKAAVKQLYRQALEKPFGEWQSIPKSIGEFLARRSRRAEIRALPYRASEEEREEMRVAFRALAENLRHKVSA
jgi:hypothetical protein